MKCSELSNNAQLILRSKLYQPLRAVVPTQVLRRAREVLGEENATTRKRMLWEDGMQTREEILARMSRAIDSIVRLKGLMDWSSYQHDGLSSLLEHHSQWLEAMYSARENSLSNAAAYGALVRVMRGIRDAPNSEILQKMALLGNESSFKAYGSDVASDVQRELRNICRQRMMWRLLIANHLSIEDGCAAGVFSPSVDVDRNVDACCAQVKVQCHSVFGSAPVCERRSVFTLQTTEPEEKGSNSLPPPTFCHVESTIAYIMNELLKNAARATMSAQLRGGSFSDKTCRLVPPVVDVEVITSTGKGVGGGARRAGSEDGEERALSSSVCVRVIDRGGGIPSECLGDVWDFGFTTATREERSGAYPIAGFGMGLPISRLFSEQFGGSLSLKPHYCEKNGAILGTVAEFWHPLEGREILDV